MLIKEQRNKKCPIYAYEVVGNLNCEECGFWKNIPSGIKNQMGIEGTYEWCNLISKESENDG